VPPPAPASDVPPEEPAAFGVLLKPPPRWPVSPPLLALSPAPSPLVEVGGEVLGVGLGSEVAEDGGIVTVLVKSWVVVAGGGGAWRAVVRGTRCRVVGGAGEVVVGAVLADVRSPPVPVVVSLAEDGQK
jgi:hypothetical protein